MSNEIANGGVSWRLDRLEREMERVRPMVERLDERVANLQADVSAARSEVAGTRALIRSETQTIRAHIDAREAEKERLSLGWWAAIFGGIIVFLSSVIGALLQISGAG